MMRAIEIIQVGASGTLFQICDGERFGIVEFDEQDSQDHRAKLSRPHVAAFLSRWLADHGVLTGSQNPPYLDWMHVELAVVVARA